MLRADNVICGTSSTGTGTLTLAACPAPPGGLDFDKWLKATGFNFVSGNALLVTYTIIEYTSSAFTTVKQTEEGVGTLTLGASISAATLARTTVNSKATGMDTSAPSPTFASATAITIGTAANTLVFVGASVDDILVGSGPYADNTPGLGFTGLGIGASNSNAYNGFASGSVWYVPLYWAIPMLAKTFTIGVGNSAGTGTTNAYAALYANASGGRPGKLLIDFGVLGSAGSSLNTTFTNISSASHASGFKMRPGFYWAAIFWVYGGGSPAFLAADPISNLGANVFGQPTNFVGRPHSAVATATANPASDPATLTALVVYDSSAGGANHAPLFTIGP